MNETLKAFTWSSSQAIFNPTPICLHVHFEVCRFMSKNKHSEGRIQSTFSVVMEESMLNAVDTNNSSIIQTVITSASEVSRCNARARTINFESRVFIRLSCSKGTVTVPQ
ncbi:hypothetical protein TNCV_4471071 [Trichonephila clavipes]|uniref:Uncharacterized protein n=1 Tax=Trichonephila clavipes TaxID=2585209 RepID=A0A8X6SMM0_TRICX|nr:hypothetical protein TNCV_4471071 [Trichonephila clavipes]